MKSDKSGNDLLAALPEQERLCILQQSECVTVEQDQILGEPGEIISHVYFPIDSVIALLTGVDQHDALAVGLIGSEGMLGFSLVLGVQTSPLRARVQGTGSALRMKADDFRQALPGMPVLESRLRQYLNVLLVQVTQNAGCAAFHIVETRLACWLLMTDDRAHAHRFYLTHDRLARMLGVRRSGVTTAACVLHSRKLIAYTRGHIAILDRKGLEKASCRCYRTMRDSSKQMGPSLQNDGDLQYGRAATRHRQRSLPRAPGQESALPLNLGVAPN